MFDVWSIVQWWDEWQLRILAIGSLCIQWFILLAAPMRKYTIQRWFRGVFWLAYVSSDALAIYALATLFNRHAKVSTSAGCGAAGASKASILEVLWAPILLIHLGGQEELTAYTIEDNELWIRHTVTLVSQVSIALYAFYKSWPSASDRRLLASAILLFIIGVISFIEKPLALRQASINRLADVSAVIQGEKKRSKWDLQLNDFFFFDEFNCFTTKSRRGHNKRRRQQQKGGALVPIYNCFTKLVGKEEGRDNKQQKKKEEEAKLSDGDKVYMILSDMSLSAAADKLVKREMAKSKEDVLPPLFSAETGMRRWLRGAFVFIYTRANVVFTLPYLVYHLLVVPALHIAALTLFATTDKHPYNYTDVKTTYVLLSFTAALDVLAVFVRQLLYLVMSMRDVPALCETMPGYNIVDAALRRRHKACCGCLVKYCEEYFVWKRDEFHNLYKRVAGFVFIDLMHARCLDLASYRNFTVPPAAPSRPSEEQQHAAEACTEITEHDRRPISEEESYSGNWVLSKKLQMKCSDNIRRALRGSFDRSVLLWHIATDMCFRMEDDADGQDPEDNYFDEWRRHKECAQAISNYMVHLLHFHPEMLMTGSRQHLVDEAMKEIKLILDDNRSSELWLRKPTQEDLENMIQQKEGKKLFQVVEACKLAKELRDMPEETRWAVMYHVWLGMLCYSASMCRGYLHAKSLGEGGEFLSFVWLVLSLKGAKTLADKLQMVDTDEEKTPAEATSSSAPKPKKNLRDKFGRR